MKVIGVTGGIGAGKSTVLNYLKEECGAHVIEADRVGHLVMEPGAACYDRVIKLFGTDIIKSDKTIDRRRVSDVVFTDEEKRRALEAIIHPAVKSYILEEIQTERERGSKLMIVEAALFLEEHYEEFCDTVWYVCTDTEIRIERLMKNRGYTREKSEQIIAGQLSDQYFREHTDLIITNNHDLEDTYRQIREGLKLL